MFLDVKKSSIINIALLDIKIQIFRRILEEIKKIRTPSTLNEDAEGGKQADLK